MNHVPTAPITVMPVTTGIQGGGGVGSRLHRSDIGAPA